MSTRVLVIAFDAADKDLIARWAASGHLPTFRRLTQRALRGTVRNPFGLYVGAIWPSFYTGLSPARHGRYNFMQLIPGTYRTRAIERNDVAGETFWIALSRAGRRVATIDVPKAPATGAPVNGIQIVDWGLHETEVDGGLWTSPRSLARTILRRYGRDPVGRCDLIQGRLEEYETLRRRLIERIAIKTRMVRDILQGSDWDLVLAGFADTHCACHQFWGLHAQRLEQQPEEGTTRAGNPLRDVYAAADRALGELLEVVGEETVCIVLASHGSGPYRGGNKLLDDILRGIDLRETDGSTAGPHSGVDRLALEALRRAWKRWTPLRLKRALITVRERAWHRLQGLLLRREYARRRYFAVPNNDACGAIRLNLIGREPQGLVSADEEDRIYAELTRELCSLIDLDTGEPAVRRVVWAKDYYARQPMDNLPDLFVEWNGERPIVRVRTLRGDVIQGYYPDYRTGDHRPDGAFWMIGPEVSPAELDEAVSNVDFAPTIGRLLGVPLPGLDGRPIEVLQREDHVILRRP